MSIDLYASLVRSAGDLGGVFEGDDETGYFYLFDTTAADGGKIVDTLKVTSGGCDFVEGDVVIVWDNSQTKVAVLIKGEVWGVFDTANEKKYSGRYPDRKLVLPESVLAAFAGFVNNQGPN